jgi:hypothetical protein
MPITFFTKKPYLFHFSSRKINFGCRNRKKSISIKLIENNLSSA